MQIPSILPHIITQISRIALKNYNYVSYTLVDFAEKSTNESEVVYTEDQNWRSLLTTKHFSNSAGIGWYFLSRQSFWFPKSCYPVLASLHLINILLFLVL